MSLHTPIMGAVFPSLMTFTAFIFFHMTSDPDAKRHIMYVSLRKTSIIHSNIWSLPSLPGIYPPVPIVPNTEMMSSKGTCWSYTILGRLEHTLAIPTTAITVSLHPHQSCYTSYTMSSRQTSCLWSNYKIITKWLLSVISDHCINNRDGCVFTMYTWL